jgi:lipoprotein signal peptidase
MDRLGRAVVVTEVVVFGDQLTKALAEHSGAPRNPDYALGTFAPTPALVIISVLMLGAFLALVARGAVQLGVPSFIPAVIAGGMLGNLVDRVRLGAVRDFIATPWAIINVADIAVIAGIAAFATALLWRLISPRPALES